jgi:flagellar hook-length control protein FliK
LADASVSSTATSPLAAQKHNFVTEALHAVSSSVASAVQSPFTAATELPKSAAAVTTIAPSASTVASPANAQTASGGGPGGAANGQSSSSRGNTQSGGSSSPDAFSVNTSGSTPAPVQPANDAAATSAMKADAAAAQSSQPNSSISTTLGEKSSASSEPTSPLQNAASSDSATASDTALPGADISQAHLLGASGAAEMRISVNTETLGPIELRATSEKDRIGAVIAAAKPETQELLNSELPTLHQALSERNLQVQQLTVSQGSLAGGMSGRGGYSQSPDAWQKQAAGNYWQPPSEATVSSTEDLPAAVVSMAVPGKLSVHA